MCIVGAIIGAAVIGAAGSAIAGSEAAGATKDASNAAIHQQQTALEQQAALSAPYRALGESAMPTLQALLGIGPPAGITPAGTPAGGGGATAGPGTYAGNSPTGVPYGGPLISAGPGGANYAGGGGIAGTVGAIQAGRATAGQGMPTGDPRTITPSRGMADPTATHGGAATSIQDTLRNLPGYQFTQQQGTQGALNAASSQGMGLSGNTLEALSKFNTGLADNYYQQYLGDIMNVTEMGQAAAAGQAANIGNAAANTGNIMLNQGNTLAGIDMNTAAGITKAIGNASNQYVQSQTLAGLQNPNAGWSEQNAPYAVPDIGGGFNPGTTTNFETMPVG